MYRFIQYGCVVYDDVLDGLTLNPTNIEELSPPQLEKPSVIDLVVYKSNLAFSLSLSLSLSSCFVVNTVQHFEAARNILSEVTTINTQTSTKACV
jgi:hypothetical protein